MNIPPQPVTFTVSLTSAELVDLSALHQSLTEHVKGIGGWISSENNRANIRYLSTLDKILNAIKTVAKP